MAEKTSTSESSPSRGFGRWSTALIDPSLVNRCLLLALLVYGAWVAWRFAPVAAGSDFSGYLHSGRLLSEGHLTTMKRTIPSYQPEDAWPYLPLGFVGAPGSNVLRPQYPIGMPLHFAAAASVFGWNWGPKLVSAAASCALLGLTWAALRLVGLSRPLAFAGTATLAMSPLLLYVCQIPFSDSVAGAWCTAALVAAIKGPRSWRWGIACGFAVSIAILVRPTCAILVPALVVCLWNFRGLVAAAIGGLPGAIGFAAYNHAMYGGATRTGYGEVGSMFRWSEVGPSFANYGSTCPFVLPVAFVALLLLPFLPWRRSPRLIAALLAWVIALLVFYSFYEVTPDVWWYLRFVLPCFPAIVVLAMLGIDGALSARGKASSRALWVGSVAVVLVSACAAKYWIRKQAVMHLAADQADFVDVCEWSRSHLPPGALVACRELSGSYYYYTSFPILRWDLLSPEQYEQLVRAVEDSKHPFYAAIMGFAEPDAIERMPGRWEPVSKFRFVTVWRYEGKK